MRGTAVLPILFTLAALVGDAPAVTVAVSPQGAVRSFCEADAQGLRVRLQTWPQVAPLVGWRLEPAWDHVVLVTGYRIGAPYSDGGTAPAVDVQYNVAMEVSALGIDTVAYVETVTYHVRTDERGAYIIGPPPPPHIFANRVDVDALRHSLQDGGVNFVADTAFAWRVLRSAGWNVEFERATELLSGPAYRVVDVPRTGDLVVYLRDDTPYHAGVLTAPDTVLSSTLNAGIVGTPIDAFAGAVRYLRPDEPEPQVPRRQAIDHGGSAPTRSAAGIGRRTPVPRHQPSVTPRRRTATRTLHRRRGRRPARTHSPVATPPPR